MFLNLKSAVAYETWYRFDAIHLQMFYIAKNYMLIYSLERFSNVYSSTFITLPGQRESNFTLEDNLGHVLRLTRGLCSIYHLLTGCESRTRKCKPKVFYTAGEQGLAFPSTFRAPA